MKTCPHCGWRPLVGLQPHDQNCPYWYTEHAPRECGWCGGPSTEDGSELAHLPVCPWRRRK